MIKRKEERGKRKEKKRERTRKVLITINKN